jgi:hypothetical protein
VLSLRLDGGVVVAIGFCLVVGGLELILIVDLLVFGC